MFVLRGILLKTTSHKKGRTVYHNSNNLPFFDWIFTSTDLTDEESERSGCLFS